MLQQLCCGPPSSYDRGASRPTSPQRVANPDRENWPYVGSPSRVHRRKPVTTGVSDPLLGFWPRKFLIRPSFVIELATGSSSNTWIVTRCDGLHGQSLTSRRNHW